MKTRMVKVGKLRIQVPVDADVQDAKNLDNIYGSSIKHPDVLLVVKYGQQTYAVIIEDTGVPEPKDLERLRESSEDLRRRELIPQGAIIVKLLHHKGSVHTTLKRLALSYKVELQRCSDHIDLALLLEKVVGRLERKHQK